jgi:AcrR family transcriptional regulator
MKTALRTIAPEQPASKPQTRATQARGRARRAELLAAARQALAHNPLDQVSMAAVAETAGIPLSSAYHFFGDISELWKELARTIATQQASEDLNLPRSASWQDLIKASLIHHQSAFNKDPAARKLMLGPHTPPDIKNAACKEDYRFGTALWMAVRSQFILPDLADSRELFFKALLIADVFFSLSVSESDQVTDEALGEAVLAVVSYLSVYLPSQLAKVG